MGTYPPRECGIATFTQDLLQACQQQLGTQTRCLVAAMNTSALDTYVYPPEVEWRVDQNDQSSYLDLAQTLNQHEHVAGVML